MTPNNPADLELVHVRTYQPRDHAAVERLYGEGLLHGQIDPTDTAADIENIEDGYLTDPANHFWVAEVREEVVGMIGVARDREHVAEIRRLRVDKAWQGTRVGAWLVQQAIAHCRKHGYLKVVFETRFERSAALEMFDRMGFQHTRSKNLHGKEIIEFYLDLYRTAKPEKK